VGKKKERERDRKVIQRVLLPSLFLAEKLTGKKGMQRKAYYGQYLQWK